MYELPVDYNKLSWEGRRAVREQYRREQNDKCVYCNNSLSDSPPLGITLKFVDWSLFPENFMKHPVHLHHDHDTGLTIGAIHVKCNAVSWQYDGV